MPMGTQQNATQNRSQQGGYQQGGFRGNGQQGQRPAPPQNNRQGPDNTALLQSELATVKPKMVKAWDPTGAETVINWVLRCYRLGDDKMARCTIKSIVDSAMQIVAWQMDPNPVLGLVYLEPRWLKEIGETQCSAKLTYRGMIELLRRSGEVDQFYAEVAYMNDEFMPRLGTEMKLVHVPAIGLDRGDFRCAYSVAWIKGSTIPSIQIMDDQDVEKCKKMARTSGVWTEWFDEQAKKSVAKRHMKWLPLSTAVKRALLVDDPPDYSLERNDMAPPPAAQGNPADNDQQADYTQPDGDQIDDPPFEDEEPAPPPAKPAPLPDAKVLREKARQLIPQVRATGPDVLDKIVEKLGLACLRDLGTAEAAVIDRFNKACEQVIRI